MIPLWLKLAIAGLAVGGLVWFGWQVNSWRQGAIEGRAVKLEYRTYRETVETERAEQAKRDEKLATDLTAIRESYAELRRRPAVKLVEATTDETGCTAERLSSGFWLRYREAAGNPG